MPSFEEMGTFESVYFMVIGKDVHDGLISRLWHCDEKPLYLVVRVKMNIGFLLLYNERRPLWYFKD